MIHVFKTSLSNTKEVKTLKPILDKHLEHAIWNFDLEDCDHILRIDSQIDVSRKTIQLLKENGFECEELPD